MKLLYKLILVTLLVIGFSPIDSRIASANLNESEILTDAETVQLTRILASEVIERLDSLIDKFSLHYRFSGNVLVAYKGQEIFTKSVGYADPLKKEPVKTNTIFQLASVSKQFTAAAILLLKAEGRIDFDDPLVKYIPELPYSSVNIYHLLHHLSGMPNYMYLVDKYWKEDKAPNNEDVVDLMAQHKLPLFFKPGSRYDYSNTGYVMLATVVERVTGLSLNDFLQRRIFQPLGMENTFVYSTADTTVSRKQADGFRAGRYGYIKIGITDNDGPVGDKGVCSTTEDMLKWDNALYKESPINQELLQVAFSPVTTSTGREVPYGCGFRIRECNGSKVIYHNGIWEGSRINFHRFIDRGNTIIVMNNTSISSNHELVRLIEKTLNDETTLDITTKITRLVIDEGLQSALDYYNSLCEIDPLLHPDIRKIMQAADYMYSIGKDKKAEEIKALCKSMVSV
ncbi:MAG TPA: serine hydrolase domain-containing protein [Lentimicrobium sp.]|nr:serine hydrolase domain-containing protein [Lentimicrobium sp.]